LQADLGSALVPRRGTPLDVLPFGERAFDVASSRARIADTLGWIHHLLGNAAKAEEYLTEASTGAATSADVHLHVAAFAASQGRTDQARAALKKALELDPALEGSRVAADVLRLLHGTDK
jgi:tetratricopeptide (TPR) repeat protein